MINCMNINNSTANYTISYHGFSSEKTLDNQAGENNTAPEVSVVPKEEVSPLLALPDELLLKVANHLSLSGIRSLALTNRRLSTLLNTKTTENLIRSILWLCL